MPEKTQQRPKRRLEGPKGLEEARPGQSGGAKLGRAARSRAELGRAGPGWAGPAGLAGPGLPGWPGQAACVGNVLSSMCFGRILHALACMAPECD